MTIITFKAELAEGTHSLKDCIKNSNRDVM